MNYIGYDFSLTKEGIGLDEELNLDRLGWRGGDYFKLVNVDGRNKLVRVDPLVKFLEDGKQNG
jgi:hypothetical protein